EKKVGNASKQVCEGGAGLITNSQRTEVAGTNDPAEYDVSNDISVRTRIPFQRHTGSSLSQRTGGHHCQDNTEKPFLAPLEQFSNELYQAQLAHQETKQIG